VLEPWGWVWWGIWREIWSDEGCVVTPHPSALASDPSWRGRRWGRCPHCWMTHTLTLERFEAPAPVQSKHLKLVLKSSFFHSLTFCWFDDLDFIHIKIIYILLTWCSRFHSLTFGWLGVTKFILLDLLFCFFFFFTHPTSTTLTNFLSERQAISTSQFQER
jgi:hypothetical protein